MLEIALPVLFVVVVWWLATGALLLMARLEGIAMVGAMVLLTVLAAVALYGLWASAAATSVAAAFLSFACALTLWAWHELALLLGLVTGPRRIACSSGATGWWRFGEAFEAVAYHELALVATLVLVILLTSDAPNQVGAAAFIVLWLMRISAKLNIFLGVRNLAEAFLPPRVGFLASYFRRSPVNFLFPFSVSFACVAAGWMIFVLWTNASLSPFELAGGLLVLTLLLLGIIEHWMMVLPFDETMPWRWAIRGQRSGTRDRLPTSVRQPVRHIGDRLAATVAKRA